MAGSVTLDVIFDSVSIFFEQQRDPDANRLAAFPARERDAFMTHWVKILTDETIPAMTIVVDGHVAGNILSWEQDDKRLVGYWIGRAYWGKGVATQALSEYLRFVAARPLYAYVAKCNIASIRVLEKCGFAICVEETDSLRSASDEVEELVFKLGKNEGCE